MRTINSLQKPTNYGAADPYAMTGGLVPLQSMSRTQPASPAPGMGSSAYARPLSQVYQQGGGAQTTPTAMHGAALNPMTGRYWEDVAGVRDTEQAREGARTDVMGQAVGALQPGAYNRYNLPADYWAKEGRTQTGNLTAQWTQGLKDLDNQLRRRLIDKPTYDAAVAELNGRMRSQIAQARAQTRQQQREFGFQAAQAAAQGLTGVMGQIPSSTYGVAQPQLMPIEYYDPNAKVGTTLREGTLGGVPAALANQQVTAWLKNQQLRGALQG